MAGEKEAPEHNVLYTYGFPSIPRFQRWYPLVNQTTRHRAMLIFLGSGSISHCIGGRKGGTGAQCSLHVRIPLDPTIPAVVSACQSDHTSQSYANISRIGFNEPQHRWEGSVTNLPCAAGMVGNESCWAVMRWGCQLRCISFVIWLFLVTGLRSGYAAAMFVFFAI